jgi:rubrerythrin
MNGEEILEIACQLERNGAAFYRRAAEDVKDSASKKLLLELAGLEDHHENMFDDMRADPDVVETLLGGSDSDGVTYLRALAGGHIFSKTENPAARITKKMTPQEIFKVAIDLEVSTVVFYQGIREVLTNDFLKGKLDTLVREEMRHVAMLSNALTAL